MELLAGAKEMGRRIAATLVVYPLSVLALRTGNWERARQRLQWVIEHHPNHFGSHIQLGRLHLHLGNRNEALHLLNQARFIDPMRFERAELPREIQTTLGRDPRFSMHDFVVESPRVASHRGSTQEVAPERSFGSLTFDHDPDVSFRYRDFSNMEEYVRFRSLPPISGTEIADVDWDDLCGRLSHDGDD